MKAERSERNREARHALALSVAGGDSCYGCLELHAVLSLNRGGLDLGSALS
jgi:hypothetical protein